MTPEQLRAIEAEDEKRTQRAKKKLSDQELWEVGLQP
jgi:hypothetical protein